MSMYQKVSEKLWPTTDCKSFRGVRRCQKKRHTKKVRQIAQAYIREQLQ